MRAQDRTLTDKHLRCQLHDAGRRALMGIAALLGVSGCSSADATRGEVSGRVTIDGAPAAAGAIAFIPADGASPTAGGKIVDGKYSVVAPFGVAKVEIRVPRVVGQRTLYDTPDSPVQPVMEESLPKQFNDETRLTLEVKPGSIEHDFELQTK
jgi:hypothetical protein